jgi:acyl-CoA thioester hydrolase
MTFVLGGPTGPSRFAVRGYEIDALGHVAHTVYLQYADQARVERLAEAGLGFDRLLEVGLMPVLLETTMRFRRELRFGDVVDVACEFRWGERKTGRVLQALTRTDGVLVAEATSMFGVLDLTSRTLVERPHERLRELATAPEPVGL